MAGLKTRQFPFEIYVVFEPKSLYPTAGLIYIDFVSNYKLLYVALYRYEEFLIEHTVLLV